jgi:hypothetical protein
MIEQFKDKSLLQITSLKIVLQQTIIIWSKYILEEP